MDLKPPFAAGQARNWLDGFHGENALRGAHGVLATQACGRLDAAAAADLAKQCLELSKKLEQGDDQTTKDFSSDTLDTLEEAALLRLADIAPDQALAMGKDPDAQVSKEHVAEIFAVAAAKDLTKAKLALDGLRDDERTEARTAVFEEWLKVDPLAMMAEIEAAPDANEKNTYLYCGAMSALADRNPDQAIQYALDRAAKGDHLEAMSSLVSVKPELVTKLADWAENYRGPDAARAQGMMISHLVESDPKRAQRLFIMASPGLDEEQRRDAAKEITLSVATDGAAAREWLASQKDGTERQTILLSLSSRAASEEPAGAGGIHLSNGTAPEAQAAAPPTAEDLKAWVAEIDPPEMDDYERMELLGRLLEGGHSDIAKSWVGRMSYDI